MVEINKKLLGERIKLLRTQNGLSASELADKIGLSRSALSMVENGHRGVSTIMAKKIADLFNVSIDYILGNTDDPTPPKKIEIKDKINLKENVVAFVGRVPILGRVAAGKPVPAIQEALGWMDIPAPYKKLGIDFALVIDGDSMSPRLNKGDLALIHMQNDAENGEIAIVIINGNDGVCKQFFKKESSVVLHSINPEYDDIIIPAEQWDEECKVVGVVVARFENFKNVKVKKTLRG